MSKRTLIGIAGDSGAGKSTYIRHLMNLLGTERVTSIGLDDYHTLDRAQRKAMGVTPLDPKANDLDLVIEHAKRLRRGESIMKPVYDHATGTFGQPEEITPTEIVLIDGLHPFYRREMHDLLDLKIYLDTHRDLKIRWKIQRDIGERGHKREDVIREIDSRQHDYQAYVEPQRDTCDLLVSVLPADPAKDYGVKVQLMERTDGNNGLLHLLRTEASQVGTIACYWQEEIYGTKRDILELSDFGGIKGLMAFLHRLGGDLKEGRSLSVGISQLLVTWRIEMAHAQDPVQELN